MVGEGKGIWRALKRFANDRTGNAAVEFGLVVVPFFLFTFGLAEVSLIGFAQASLDHAVSETVRDIRTGQAQGRGANAQQMKMNLCSQLTSPLSLDCNQELFLDVDSYPSFVIPPASPIANGSVNTTDFGYSPGCASDIVVVRAYYRWHVITPMFQSFFSNMNDGERLLVSSMMFRNEPFGACMAPSP